MNSFLYKLTSSPRHMFIAFASCAAIIVSTQFAQPVQSLSSSEDADGPEAGQEGLGSRPMEDQQLDIEPPEERHNNLVETDPDPVETEEAITLEPTATAEADNSVTGTPEVPPVTEEDAVPVLRPTSSWFNVFGESALLYGRPVQIGDVISAFDSQGTLAGQFTVTHEGKYGLMAIYEDDPTTEIDEGTEPGDQLSFEINGVPAVVLGPEIPEWNEQGTLLRLNLTAGESVIIVGE